MDAFFGRILEISLSGSVIVLTVLVLRFLLRRAPRRAVCLLWMIAVLRLLVPFEIESEWSLQPDPVVEFVPPVREEYFDSGTVQVPVSPEYLEDAVEYPLSEQPQQEEPVAVLPWLWLAGVGLLALHGIVSFWRLKRRVREAVILEEGVWICPGLDTAFVLGFFRPRVYLPVLTTQERELVLLHERCHIRRLDHWWKLMAYAAVTLHWFNPLAWVTYILMCRDMELACDQETVKGMDNAMRKAYSAALLRCAVKRSGIAACPVAFGEISVKERIKMVLNYKKPGFWVTVIALIAAVAVGVCLLTSPKELTDLERCEQALKEWQEMDVWEFHQTQSNVGDMVENEWSVMTFWSSDGEHLMKFNYAENLGDWQHWKDGKSYIREFGSLDAEWEDTGWRVADFQENVVIPWIMRLDWDALTIHHWEAADDGKIVQLTVDFPTLGPGTLSFHFDEDGKLWSVSRSFSQPSSSVSTGTIELVRTDREWIEQAMDRFGVVPELVQLYSELERLRTAEYVHVLIDTVDETDYPGPDVMQQEYIRNGENYYLNYNYNYQTVDALSVVTYLKYGGKLYGCQYSNTDGELPNHDWKEIPDRGFREIWLLEQDRTHLPVLEIEKTEDGSAVILVQGVLEDTEKTTYSSSSYEFHLDPEGKLVAEIHNFDCRVLVHDYYAEGMFNLKRQSIVHYLDTPAEELKARILAVKEEAIG